MTHLTLKYTQIRGFRAVAEIVLRCLAQDVPTCDLLRFALRKVAGVDFPVRRVEGASGRVLLSARRQALTQMPPDDPLVLTGRAWHTAVMEELIAFGSDLVGSAPFVQEKGYAFLFANAPGEVPDGRVAPPLVIVLGVIFFAYSGWYHFWHAQNICDGMAAASRGLPFEKSSIRHYKKRSTFWFFKAAGVFSLLVAAWMAFRGLHYWLYK